MKIALVVPGGVDRSGDTRVIPALLALMRRLANSHELHVYALSQEPRPGTWMLEGARVHNVGAGWTRARAVGAIVREHRVAPFHVLQSVWSGAPGTVAVTAARLLRRPCLVHVAGLELVSRPDVPAGGRRQWRGRLREAVNLGAASAITAASAPIVQSLAALGHRAERVPLGVDLESWPSRSPRRRAGNGPVRLIHVASLNPVKDQATLLHALVKLAVDGVDFRMDVVGEDTLGGRVQALARQLGLASRVRFHGFLTRRQLRPLVEGADVHVVSSRHETGPLVALEAAVAGVPTVGTRVGHLAEWASTAALAVDVGDADALAAAIRALASDEERRLQIAEQAWQRATAEDADCTAARFQALYTQVSSGR
jgi:glycosyltransferase involved in cell wall biosynthesis